MKTAWLPLIVWLTPVPALALQVSGLVELRAIGGDQETSWIERELGKQRFGEANDGLRLGQAVVEARAQVLDTLSATLVANGYDDRNGFADLSEAYLTWKPLPDGPWRWKTRLGAFFPNLSLENTDIGWTSPYMSSTSAINTWIGEEFRTLGGELELSRPGRFVDSPHDVFFRAAVFKANDPAGGLLTWRGFSIGDRVSSLNERIPFADLPAYRSDGALARQADWIEPFKEIDGRWGYYMGGEYRYANRWELRALHYDNRGDPRTFSAGQYGWQTRFDHLSLKWQADENWEILGQYLAGITRMGFNPLHAVDASYHAWYVLASHTVARHRFSLRYDHFEISDHDKTPDDDNGETGDGLALAYRYQWNDAWSLGAEWLSVASEREAREYLGQAPRQRENSLGLSLKWHF